MCGIWLLNNNFIMNISIWFCPNWFALIECSFFLKLFLSELVHFRLLFYDFWAHLEFDGFISFHFILFMSILYAFTQSLWIVFVIFMAFVAYFVSGRNEQASKYAERHREPKSWMVGKRIVLTGLIIWFHLYNRGRPLIFPCWFRQPEL